MWKRHPRFPPKQIKYSHTNMWCFSFSYATKIYWCIFDTLNYEVIKTIYIKWFRYPKCPKKFISSSLNISPAFRNNVILNHFCYVFEGSNQYWFSLFLFQIDFLLVLNDLPNWHTLAVRSHFHLVATHLNVLVSMFVSVCKSVDICLARDVSLLFSTLIFAISCAFVCECVCGCGCAGMCVVHGVLISLLFTMSIVFVSNKFEEHFCVDSSDFSTINIVNSPKLKSSRS